MLKDSLCEFFGNRFDNEKLTEVVQKAGYKWAKSGSDSDSDSNDSHSTSSDDNSGSDVDDSGSL